MKEARKIGLKVICLIFDMLVFTYQIVSKVILPTRRRKGNILSSLLSFFVGLIERVLSFEKSILCRSVVCKHKYVKQALILTAGFLFLLSSVEWTISLSSRPAVIESQKPVSPEKVATSSIILKQDEARCAPKSARSFYAIHYLSPDLLLYPLFDKGVIFNRGDIFDGTVALKRYLRCRILRI